MKPKHAFVIRYKSGAEVHVRADKLSVATNRVTGEKVRMEWVNMKPHPLEIGDLSDIESVWQVDA